MNDFGFYLFTAYLDKFKRLTDEQFGKLARYLLEYKMTGEIPEIEDQVVGMAFDIIQLDVDKQAEKYRMKAEAGRKGGSAQKHTEADVIKTKQNEADESNVKQCEADASNKNKKENKNIDIDISGDRGVGEEPKSKRFVPPTLDEVRAYCRERNNSVDPVAFYEYFTTGNWTDSKGQKVRNWKQKLITWEKHHAKPKVKPNSFFDFQQNSYTREELEALVE